MGLAAAAGADEAHADPLVGPFGAFVGNGELGRNTDAAAVAAAVARRKSRRVAVGRVLLSVHDQMLLVELDSETRHRSHNSRPLVRFQRPTLQLTYFFSSLSLSFTHRW